MLDFFLFLSSIFLRDYFCFSESSGRFAFSSNAFIFSLRNKDGLRPFKSMVRMPSRAIVRVSDYGPTFGAGYDIHIANNANSNTTSFTNFGDHKSYFVPSGVLDPYTILAGSRYFSPDEVEVFYLG